MVQVVCTGRIYCPRARIPSDAHKSCGGNCHVVCCLQLQGEQRGDAGRPPRRTKRPLLLNTAARARPDGVFQNRVNVQPQLVMCRWLQGILMWCDPRPLSHMHAPKNSRTRVHTQRHCGMQRALLYVVDPLCCRRCATLLQAVCWHPSFSMLHIT